MQLFSIFLLHDIKMSVLINLKYMSVTWLFKLVKFM